MTATNLIMPRIAASAAELDRDLLLSALNEMIGRFIRLSRLAGYEDALIDRLVESEIALVHRIASQIEIEEIGK